MSARDKKYIKKYCSGDCHKVRRFKPFVDLNGDDKCRCVGCGYEVFFFADGHQDSACENADKTVGVFGDEK